MVKPSDIKDILKKRGVYSSSNEKKTLGPILVKSGISPEEFESLKESIQTKEENPKVQSRKLKWESDDSLIEAIPHNFDFSNLVDDPFGVLSIDNAPVFTVAGDGTNTNHLIAEVTLKRNDKTKNFGDDVTYHQCSIELRIDDDKNVSLNVLTKHSSKETLNLVNKVTRRIHNHLKDNGYVSNEPIEKILFGNFTNENRIDFLVAMAKSNEKYLYYKDMKKVHMSPDEDVKGVVPTEIELFEKKVNDLMFKGKNLDSSVYLKKNALKKHIKLCSVTSRYELDDNEHQGSCLVRIHFPEFDDDSELLMEVENLNIQKKLPAELKSDIKLQILKFLETKKMTLYTKYSKKQSNP
ncbi:hypothetical protein Swoo_2431 [Shewanella woodyi ATCC 51908]|uniref:GAPS4b N-terminal domain-containing protein n=2 Tax=Shewanella woodyi TaxID=60961 RepID=B1KG02_SHEWM|nr:hypothetical protein Swoo_2431 [Shewanella woodyi ATCC 51908]